VTDKPQGATGWISSYNLVEELHLVCLLKTAAKAVNVPIQNLPSRALVLVVQPVYMNSWNNEKFDINMPHTWSSINDISIQGRSRWKYAALGVITTIRAALMHACFSDALVMSSSRTRDGTSNCILRIYICRNMLVSDVLEFCTTPELLQSTIDTEVPKAATVNALTNAVFITDMDPLSSKVAWGDSKLDERMADVISDISPTHVEDFSSFSASPLTVALARPCDMVNVAMQMACSDAYNDIWVTKLKDFVAFRKLNVKPDEPFDYHY
jgi:hypothetical protein